MTVDEYVSAVGAYDPQPGEETPDIRRFLGRLWDAEGITADRDHGMQGLWALSVRWWSATHGFASRVDPAGAEHALRIVAAEVLGG